MATQRVADDDDAFVLDEGLNEADEELVAFGATDADASGGGRSAAGAAAAGGVAGGGSGPTAAKAAVADGATTPALVGAVASAAAGNANGSSREEMAGDRGGAAGEAAAPTAGASAPLAAPPPPGSGLHGVVVSNVASDGHTEELLEILVCCGPMAGSAFEPLADGTLVGMALFAEAEAVDAALTLDGSRFQGRTLAVVREPSVASALTAEAALAALPGLVRQHQAALAAGTPMARDSPAAAGNDVQAALLRSVSVVGEESRKLAERIQAARLTRVAAASAADAAAATRRAWADVDAEYHVSERVSAARASAGETVATVDAQLHVRERVGDAVSVLRRGAGDLDASLGVTSGISALASSVGGATRKIAGEVDETWNVSTRARVAAATALENEGVRSVLATWSSWMAPLQGGDGGGGGAEGQGIPQRRPPRAPAPAGSRGGTPRREDSLPSPGGRRGPHEP